MTAALTPEPTDGMPFACPFCRSRIVLSPLAIWHENRERGCWRFDAHEPAEFLRLVNDRRALTGSPRVRLSPDGGKIVHAGSWLKI